MVATASGAVTASRIALVPIGAVDAGLLQAVREGLAAEYRVPCAVAPFTTDPSRALHPERRQYHSTELLASLSALPITDRVIGITAVDLYIPILTFVFGEAELGGRCAVISSHRLDDTFYGLRADAPLARTRTIKCAIHEIGHTHGLVHCDDYECVMAASHSVEWLDLKRESLCDRCAALIR
jgi:archaemetzincin